MKTRDLKITVTYMVELGDIEIPDDVFSQLQEMEYKTVDWFDSKYEKATDWLRFNITENDCMDMTYEIEEITPEE